jgi:hypothetical protein
MYNDYHAHHDDDYNTHMDEKSMAAQIGDHLDLLLLTTATTRFGTTRWTLWTTSILQKI